MEGEDENQDTHTRQKKGDKINPKTHLDIPLYNDVKWGKKQGKKKTVKVKKPKEEKTVIPKRKGRIKTEWFKVISRKEWSAANPTKVRTHKLPVKDVFVTTTRTAPCADLDECKIRVRELQRLFMEEDELIDIPYNYPDVCPSFLVGGDGLIFQGRGWTKAPIQLEVQDHDEMPPFISIAFIGNTFLNVLEAIPIEMKTSMHKLLDFGVAENLIGKLHHVDICTLYHPDDTSVHFSPGFDKEPCGKYKPKSNKIIQVVNKQITAQ